MAQQNGTSVPATQEKKQTIVEYFSSKDTRKAIKAALPKHLTVDRYMRIVLTAFNKTPKLQQCTITSLWSAILWLSQKGLEPDGYKAHLIPYGTECKVVIDYKGLVDLARRSKEVGDIHADVVYEKDFFEYEFGTNAHLTHRPASGDRGKITNAYSCVVLKGFEKPSFEVMNVDEIYAVRDRSEGWKAFKAGKVSTSTWKTGTADEKEMMKKTVFRRHSKWLPVSEDFHDAIQHDFDAPDFEKENDQASDLMPAEKEAPSIETNQDEKISAEQVKQFAALLVGYKIDEQSFGEYLMKEFCITSTSDLKKSEYPLAIEWVTKNRKTR